MISEGSTRGGGASSGTVARVGVGEWRVDEQGWVQLAPRGEFPHGSGVIQVVDDEAMRRMVEAARGGPALLVDYDHFSLSQDRPSEAAGWILGLEAREDGLWARVRWTPEGELALREGRYRYLSPVWLPEMLEGLGTGRVRPVRLHSAGLTNLPNLSGIRPLSNRGGGGGGGGGGGVNGDWRQNTTNGKDGTMMTTDRETLVALGLPEGAAAGDVAGKVQALVNRARELEAERNDLLERQAELDLERYADAVKPEARAVWKEALLTNRRRALEMLEGVVRTGGNPARVHQGGTGGPPAAAQQPADAAGRVRAKVLLYRNRSGCGFDEAWQAVKAEQPELFRNAGAGAGAGGGH